MNAMLCMSCCWLFVPSLWNSYSTLDTHDKSEPRLTRNPFHQGAFEPPKPKGGFQLLNGIRLVYEFASCASLLSLSLEPVHAADFTYRPAIIAACSRGPSARTPSCHTTSPSPPRRTSPWCGACTRRSAPSRGPASSVHSSGAPTTKMMRILISRLSSASRTSVRRERRPAGN